MIKYLEFEMSRRHVHHDLRDDVRQEALTILFEKGFIPDPSMDEMKAAVRTASRRMLIQRSSVSAADNAPEFHANFDRYMSRTFDQCLNLAGEPLEPRTEHLDVQHAVAELPPRQQAVIIGMFYDQKIGTELANELGITRGTLDAHRKKAIKNLRKWLTPPAN